MIDRKRAHTLGVLSLVTSVGTLLCCALPALLVFLGFGAVVASVVSSVPLLVTLSRHKAWVFAAAGALLGFGVAYRRWLVPRLTATGSVCPPDDPPCAAVDRWSGRLLGASAVLYVFGFVVAYLLPMILTWQDG